MRHYRAAEKIYCNMCGSVSSGDDLDTLETIFVDGMNAITICPDCYEEMDGTVKTCPRCDVHVHVDEIADTGVCPCCTFHEEEHTGSSWI
jgi:hypothetical protein